ncbi:hypothetical protein P170DRAFT_463876 [Aspergillus steynii IBT 23096]|uniref:Serine hydrolase domain-containing protein n=1 Tax=Aspergillus steynii IBT 23096 TaxID=1392250 RepID=A0A2I2GD20_9EURO|nr:uncharacterized protein P170DRAFT_463876 [Aspergillus steynii IBT 23096]PLB50765.1 hypothetical protein P170DRAFT_463876 [Aspergillus steynii IBT 23096]
MRFLCLHGQGTSSDVLKTQLASLRNHLDQRARHEYDFVDGAVLWPPARGIREVFGDEVESFSYFDEGADSIRAAVVDLAANVEAQGPFDGVIGFSQGAVLAATLILAQQTHGSSLGLRRNASPSAPPDPPFRCAVFLCGGLPFDWAALERGTVELIRPFSSSSSSSGGSSSGARPAECPPVMDLPVVNCWADHDDDYPGMGPPLSQLCASDKNRPVVHTVGHAVPAEGKELMALVEAVQATLDDVGN